MHDKATPDRDGLRPPSYVNVPASIAYTDVDGALLQTMIRILGLCWNHDHRRTPPLTLAELCQLTGRPKSTLHRHLRRLEEDLGWLRIARDGLRLTLYPRVSSVGTRSVATEETAAPPGPSGGGSGPGGELWRALQAAGIEEPARSELARDPALDPTWVRAWHLWTRHPHRGNLVNPMGAVVQRLRRRQQPPESYLRLAALTPEETAQLREAYWLDASTLPADLQRLHALHAQILGPRAAASTV